MIKDSNFGPFLHETRTKKKVTLEQLSDGLCTASLLCRIENGTRDAEKLLRDCLLMRLGVVPENYENFLYYSVYKRWKDRQNIVHEILYGDIPKASRFLTEYENTYKMENPLEEQFYLTMLGQIRSYEGADREELRNIFHRAVDLTIKELDKRNLKKRILSVEEINLYLEYLHYSEGEEVLLKYEELFVYIEKMELDESALARVYPKLVYYFAVALKEQNKIEKIMAGKIIKLCDKAVEILQKVNRMFFLWELLGVKKKLLLYLIEVNQLTGERSTGKLKEWLEKCNAWRETLGSVYEEYGVSKETKDFCYLYVDREVYCIGDVIRIRRKMFGMTMAQLSDGICSERTISRLERNKTEPQKEVVRALFERLHMSSALYKTDLVTENPDAIKLFTELKEQMYKRNCENVEQLLQQVKEKVSLEIPENKQALKRAEITNEFYKKNLTEEQYVNQLKKAIEYTIPYKVAITLGEKCLTNNEISCLQNIISQTKGNSLELKECIDVLYDLYENQKQIENCLNMYEFVMKVVSSHLGNQKEYDISDEIDKKILLNTLINRRLRVIHFMVYGLFWNQEQRKKEQHPIEMGVDKKQVLINCIHLCEMCANLRQISFYKRKLEE